MRKKAWKKNIAILLVIAMMLTIMPMTVFAEGETDENDVTSESVQSFLLNEAQGEVEAGVPFNVVVEATTDSAVSVRWTIGYTVEEETTKIVDKSATRAFENGLTETTVITATFLDENGNIITNEQGEDIYSVSATFNVTEKDEEIVATPLPEPPEVKWEIPKSKTATNLDENFESKVTLSLPSAQEPVEFDVMFVLDKSESTAKSEISKAVGDLLDDIKGSQGKVNIGVVTFNKTVVNSLGLTPLTAENLGKIQEAIEYTNSSGTNIHAGLQKGMELLDQGTAAKDKKYLVLVSDGITYLYNDEKGEGPKTINNHGQSSPDDYKGKYGNTNAPENWAMYLGEISKLVEEDGTTYEGTYQSWNQIEGASKGLYGGGGYGNDPLEDHAMSVDKALLRTYEAYTEAMGKYGTTHVYAIGRDNANYLWAGSFMNYLSSISAKEQDIEEIINHDIYYLLDAGSQVKDYMGYVDGDNGYNFDFVNEASAMTLTVGDESYDAFEIAGNQYGFKPIENGYAYTITYNKGNGKGEEHFVWDINVPVSNFAPVQLTYTVQLMNPQTKAGTYGMYDADGSLEKDALYTNNSATLYPVDSNGDEGKPEEFAKPTVSYAVLKTITPTVPEWEKSKSKTATNLDNNFESKVTLSLPSASYKGNLDVAFVLDGSTSADEKDLAAQAANLLDELSKMENLNVKASLTVFGGSKPILEDTGLVDISNTEALQDLKAKLTDPSYDKKDGRSGSNLQAGVEAARTHLNNDKTVDSADKYMIILSDGAARMWYENGQAMSQTYLPDKKIFWNSNEDFIKRYDTEGVALRRFSEVWTAGQSGVAIDAYGMSEAEKNTATINSPKVASWDTVATDSNYYTTYEAATYYAATSIVKAADEANVIFVSYPYHTGTNYGTYTESFKSWLAENKVVTRYDNANMKEAEIFSAVKDELIYLVDAGSEVVDVIGYDDAYNNDMGYHFDFVNDIEKLNLTVNGTTLDVTQISTNKNGTVYGFGSETGSKDGNTYPFKLHYYPNGTDREADEHFVWEINVPVKVNEPVQLTYSVKLTDPTSTAGTYNGLETNNSATLYPVDSNKNPLPAEEFEKPTVSYTVEKTEPGPGPGPGPGNSDITRNVTKVWKDDAAANRPDSITVNILYDGSVHQKVTLNATNDWTYAWKTSGGGWTVEEANVPAGYTSSVSTSGNDFIITNTYTGIVPEEPITDPDVPTTEPDVPSVVINEPGVPTMDVPGTPVNPTEIAEPEVPLGDAPKTGDTAPMVAFAGLMAAAVVGLVITRRKFN